MLTFLFHLGKFSLQHNGNSRPLRGILELPNKRYVEGGNGCCQRHAAQNLPLLHVKIEHRCSQQRRWGLFGSTSSGIRMKPPRSWCQKYSVLQEGPHTTGSCSLGVHCIGAQRIPSATCRPRFCTILEVLSAVDRAVKKALSTGQDIQ